MFDVIGSTVISLSLPNDEGSAPPPSPQYFFLEPPWCEDAGSAAAERLMIVAEVDVCKACDARMSPLAGDAK